VEEAMIELQSVHKTFRRGGAPIPALRGVGFAVPKASTAFIVGPSGSGKSTLLHLLGALDRPDSGKLLVGGQDVAAMSEDEQDEYRLNRVGFIFQSFNLFDNLSALENVLVPLLPMGKSAVWRRKAIDLLGRLGLGDRLHHRPSQLSGGQQQRVAIVRALVKDPDVLLADEPTGELDSRSGDAIFRLLRELQAERGTTVLVVTHDRRFIRDDDLVIEIEDGRVTGARPAPPSHERDTGEIAGRALA
jgi:putative ABC transport system ATP-binding protein